MIHNTSVPLPSPSPLFPFSLSSSLLPLSHSSHFFLYLLPLLCYNSCTLSSHSLLPLSLHSDLSLSHSFLLPRFSPLLPLPFLSILHSRSLFPLPSPLSIHMICECECDQSDQLSIKS